VKSIRTRLSKWARWLAETRRKAAAWRWGSPIARAAAVALGLVVLAAIGRSALARGANKGAGPSPEPAPAEVVPEPHAVDALASSASAPATPAASTAPLPADAGGAGTGEVAARRATPDDPVYLNQATLADLRRLPGVGAKRAQAILALRDRIQHFRQIEDLLKVKGIGRASLRKLRPLVRLDVPPSPLPSLEEGGVPSSG
jgi:competence protein ComEA